MFRIIYQDELLGFVDQPIYVKRKDGIWISCERKDAEAIAFESVAYEGAIAAEIESYKVIDKKDAAVQQLLTDAEINQIENMQALTDHDIAILELQNGEA